MMCCSFSDDDSCSSYAFKCSNHLLNFNKMFNFTVTILISKEILN